MDMEHAGGTRLTRVPRDTQICFLQLYKWCLVATRYKKGIFYEKNTVKFQCAERVSRFRTESLSLVGRP